MIEKRKPLPVCETGSGESGQLSLGGVQLPDTQFTTVRPGAQGLASLLRPGPDNAVTVGRIAALWDCDARAVTMALYNARRLGTPICSGTSGLYLPRDEADVRLCVRSMRHRAKEITRSAAALARAWIKQQEACDDGQ